MADSVSATNWSLLPQGPLLTSSVHWAAFAPLLVTALAVMGSPGPATISLTATGAAFGVRRSLAYLAGIVVGTSVVLVAVATGITATLLAVPSLRPTMPSNPEAPVPTTAPANAAVDRPTGPIAPAKPSTKTPGVEPAPQITPPSTSPGRPAGESEEGSAPRASQSKSAATPPATSPPTSSSSESEEGATPRSAPSKPAASQPAPPAASSPTPPTEEEATAPKPAKPRTGTAKLPGSSAATPTRKSGITGEGSPPRQSKEVERSRPKSSPGIFGEEQGTETLPIMPR